MMYIFSLVRSGSTLFWNLLRDIDKRAHKLDYEVKQAPYAYSFVLYRDMRDVVLSRMRVNHIKETKSNITKWVGLTQKGFNSLNEFHGYYLDPEHPSAQKVTFIKYEDYYNDLEKLIDTISRKVKVNVTPERSAELIEKYNVEQMKTITDAMGGFNTWDKNTKFHGEHISDRLGAPNYWAEHKYSQYLTELLTPYLEKWGYELHQTGEEIK